MKFSCGLVFVLFLLIEKYSVFADRCNIRCYYFPKSEIKILKCQPIEKQLQKDAYEVNCVVNPQNGKLIFIIGSRETIDRIEPENWALSPPETREVDHLEFDLHIPVIDSNTIAKVFPNLRSLVIYKTENITVDAFKDLKNLQEMKIGRKSDFLIGKSLLFSQNAISRGLILRYNTRCFRCNSKDLPESSFFVDFLSINNDDPVESIKFSNCPIDNSRLECKLKFKTQPISSVIPKLEEHHDNDSRISKIESRNYSSLIVLIGISIWTFILSIAVLVIMVLIFQKIQKRKESFVEHFTKEPLFVGSAVEQTEEN